jgi:GNAT superfamily N-acetyltransferase
MIERMKLEDVDNILENLYPAYFKEAIYNKLTPSLSHARVTIANYLNSFAYVAKHEGRVVGIAVADMGNTFYEEIECDINMFFVHPDARRSGVARGLRDAILEDAARVGAKVIYTSCLSGISEQNEQLYMNLWAKCGFQKLGTVMIRI